MTYKVFAKIAEGVPNFGGQSMLVAEGVEEGAICLLCRDVAEFGFLAGGKVGTKLWMMPGWITQMWANPESPLVAVN